MEYHDFNSMDNEPEASILDEHKKEAKRIAGNKPKKLTREKIRELIDMRDVDYKYYSHDEVVRILKEDAKLPNANATNKAKVVIEDDNCWIYFITGYTKSSDITYHLVKGWHTETGSGYLRKITCRLLKLKILEHPIPLKEIRPLL